MHTGGLLVELTGDSRHAEELVKKICRRFYYICRATFGHRSRIQK